MPPSTSTRTTSLIGASFWSLGADRPVGPVAERPLVPDLHGGQHDLGAHLDQLAHVAGAGDEVLAGDDEGVVDDAGLHAVEREVDLVAHVEQPGVVAPEVLGDLPLPEQAHDLEVALAAAHEELLVVGRERHVAVVVDVGVEPHVDEGVEDPPAQRVLVRRGREVG